MRVGIVLHPFGNSAKGLEQYVYESTRSMLTEGEGNISFTVFVKGHPDTSGLPKSVPVINLPNTRLWKWQLVLWRRECDAFVFFTESAPLLLWKKSVIVFFDAAYHYFKDDGVLAAVRSRVLWWWRALMLRSALHVVTISKASKRDLVGVFHVAEQRVSVIYPGFKEMRYIPGEHEYTYDRPYFMYIGPMKERKNVLGIVSAFARFKRDTGLPHRLVLVGRQGDGAYAKRVLETIRVEGIKHEVVCESAITDEMLPAAYAHAAALVFPSLLEGFGLPVLEALSVGTMVITSNTTSTAEAAGDAGILVDPADEAAIALALEKVARGDYNEDSYKSKAAVQAASFSWQRSGREWAVALGGLFNT